MERNTRIKGISPKAIGRLSLYRRALHSLKDANATNVFSYELANIVNVTRSQVRQDIMCIGYKGSPQAGYEISKLLQAISRKLGNDHSQKLVLLGVGHLGKAILQFFQHNHPNIELSATFDIDPELLGKRLNGVPILRIDQLEDLVISEKITLAILAVPSGCAQQLADRLTASGVRSILNFTAIRLHVPDGVFVENNDISLSLERMAFFGNPFQEVLA